MRIIKILALMLLLSCNNNSKTKNDLGIIIDLVKQERLSEADSIFHSITYAKNIDFNYSLLDVILKFKTAKFVQGLTGSQTFITKYPNSPFGYYYAGLCDFNLNKYDSAESYFDQAMASFNNSSKNGLVYLEKRKDKNRFDEGSIYNDLIFMAGLSKRFSGKYKASIEYMESSISQQYRIGDSYLIIGDCYSNLNDTINARQYYVLAKQNGNKDAEKFLGK